MKMEVFLIHVGASTVRAKKPVILSVIHICCLCLQGKCSVDVTER